MSNQAIFCDIKNHLISIDVSLCIVNWNTKDLTMQLIESIYKTVKQLSIEIFVVDNASIDGSADKISNNYPKVNIIKNSINVGYGAALNQALRKSNGRYKMILNSDIIFLEKSLEDMVNFLDNNKDIGAIGPILLDKENQPGPSYGYFPRPILIILERLLGSKTPRCIMPPPIFVKPSNGLHKPIAVEYITGASMLVRKEVCDKIGLLDESFFAYYEETDWCYRMMKKGIKRCLVPTAKVIHYTDSSFCQVPEKSTKYFEDSRVIFLKKHYGKAHAFAYICANAWANFRHKIKTSSLLFKGRINKTKSKSNKI